MVACTALQVAPIAAHIISSNAGEHGPRANTKCGNFVTEFVKNISAI